MLHDLVRVQVRVPFDLALHVADAGTLARRAPSFSTPPGSTPIFLRGFTLNPWEHGALAAEVLLRELNPQALRYSPSREMHPAFSYLWRTCPTSGLDLPDEVAHENWFRKNAGMETWTPPSALGVKGSATSLSNVAWFVLTRPTAEATAKVLLDLGFRLDVAGARGALSAQLASHVAMRWQIGQGLIQVAKLGKVWLNPRCLRWVVRELAAASAASRPGSDVFVDFDADAHLLAMEWFPHLLGGAQPDVADLVLAMWMLHEGFHGVSDRDEDVELNPLRALTELGFSTSVGHRVIDRFASWSSIWDIDDDHHVGRRLGWNGSSPTELREAFRSTAGLTPREWIEAALAILATRWVAAQAGIYVRYTDADIAQQLSPREGFAQVVNALVADYLASTFDDLGDRVLAESDAYNGLGTTSQTEWSALHDRPVVRFPDGDLVIASAEAFAARAVAVPREFIEREGEMKGRAFVGGVLGRMFEAYGTDVVSRLRSTHHVLTGEDIDACVVDGKRADAVVSSSDAAVVLEFSLQTTPHRVRHSDESIRQVLKKYAKKARQSTGTPVHAELASSIPKLGAQLIGHFVVVDEPMPFSAVHSAAVRESASDIPDLFVISIDELQALVDLADAGHSFPLALIAWQRGERKIPFVHHIAELERLTGPRRQRVVEFIERTASGFGSTTSPRAA